MGERRIKVLVKRTIMVDESDVTRVAFIKLAQDLQGRDKRAHSKGQVQRTHVADSLIRGVSLRSLLTPFPIARIKCTR